MFIQPVWNKDEYNYDYNIILEKALFELPKKLFFV